ncbi:Vacuolar protein-sorting-associated protein 27 [Gaertneriomyces sp. JEL0708]|nr:Vacuolar protein-sorting-associated protein 27 [Gaertneriomyces sp. JEL0708]
MSFLFSNPFDDLVEKATSENLPTGTDDLVTNLEIADKIKAKEVTARAAATTIKRRINHSNPNVQLLALKLADTCVKNSGHHFVQEVASREFIDNLVSIVRAPTGTNSEVRQKALALIQLWGVTFKSKPDLSYVPEVYQTLKLEGYSFPPLERAESSSAMIETATAPEWTDSDICMRCRTAFTTFNRKHHCRNCGQTFCGQCSAKTLALPQFGLTDEVRVCDTCYTRVTSKSPPGTPAFGRASAVTKDNDVSRREEEELQKAIALSLEASQRGGAPKPKAPVSKPKPVYQDDEDDEDLKAAIAASLKDAGSTSSHKATPGSKPDYVYQAPPTREEGPTSAGFTNGGSSAASKQQQQYYDSNELSAVELENIRLFSELVERTEADVAVRGYGVLQHSQIQTLYNQISTMQPKLARNLDDTTRKHDQFYALNDRLTDAIKQYDNILQERLANAGYGQAYNYQQQSYQRSEPVPGNYPAQYAPHQMPPPTGYTPAPPVGPDMNHYSVPMDPTRPQLVHGEGHGHPYAPHSQTQLQQPYRSYVPPENPAYAPGTGLPPPAEAQAGYPMQGNYTYSAPGQTAQGYVAPVPPQALGQLQQQQPPAGYVPAKEEVEKPLIEL